MRFQTLWEARWILFIEVLVTVGLYLLTPWLMVPGLLLILFTFYFFRDPERVPPGGEEVILAAADGVVSDITEIEEVQITHSRMKRVGIFLSVFDVHTNRAPIAGEVIYSEHYVGQFLDARHKDATRLNEYRMWGFRNGATTIAVRQITGAIARRIVAWSKVGDTVGRGERFGMIRFGSRTEIYMPLEAEITVQVGERVQGGLSVIARLPAREVVE
ncbi:MAG TPA: phosphatidylserine decarboxylase [Chthoniobacteraceae bacterium]|nr:phosphatidylserine decarboxylase [Chthoniobacteraceae bacterium]